MINVQIHETHSAVKSVRGRSSSRDKMLRQIVAISAAGILDFIPITLFQLGIIRHLPDPPGKIFNSDKVNGSKDAQLLGIPDGVVSLTVYAGTMLLAGGMLSRVVPPKTGRILLAGTLIGQAIGGASYLTNMISVQRRICLYCVTGALLNFASLIPLSGLFRKRRSW